jgi:hypothetical protein
MKRVDTPPPLKKQTTGFKGFFFDMRSMPKSPLGIDPASPKPVTLKQRAPIVSKSSLQSLGSKLSIPKLNRVRSSRQMRDQPPTSSVDPFRVTSFQQTPFSQRYGDARRAKMNQIRLYLEESLREDSAEADDAVMSMHFELDVPDHLPNSPLCPLSEKHKSGGKAICPFHGRKKGAVKIAGKDVGADGKGKQSEGRKGAPTIVFESSQRDGSGRYGMEDAWRLY